MSVKGWFEKEANNFSPCPPKSETNAATLTRTTFQRQDHEMPTKVPVQAVGNLPLKVFCRHILSCLVWINFTQPEVRRMTCQLKSSLSGMPGFTFLTYCNAWWEGCGLGGDQEVCRSWIKQVTMSTVQRPFEEKAISANRLLWLLHDCHRDGGVLKNHRCPYQTSSWRRLLEFHLGTTRFHLAVQGHHVQWPNCCLSPKSFPPSATTVVFMAPFQQTVMLAWFKRRAVEYPSQKNSSLWTLKICLQVLHAQIVRQNFFTVQKPRLAYVHGQYMWCFDPDRSPKPMASPGALEGVPLQKPNPNKNKMK